MVRPELGPGGEPVRVIRSRRRKRTVSISKRSGIYEVSIPASFSKKQETEWVEKMLARISGKAKTKSKSDTELFERALELTEKYVPGAPKPESVRWSTRQRARWGSCTPSNGTIRISTLLQDVPDWVLDYVLIHELTHLVVPDHGKEFKAIMGKYERFDEAKGFLSGYSLGMDTGR